VGKLPKAVKSAEADAKRARDKARATEKSASDAASRAMQALAREREKHEGAAADAQRCARDLAAAQAELKAALPRGVTSDANTLDGQVLEMDRRAAVPEKLAVEIDGERKKRDELAKLVAESAQQIAAMRGQARGLAEEAAAAQAEGDASMKTLLATAAEWDLADVAASIEAKRDPSPQLEALQRDVETEIEALTRTIARLERDEERIEKAIARAAELREMLMQILEQAALCGELGMLLRANNFQSYVLEEAMRSLAESATEHLRLLYPRFEITESKGEFLVRDAWQAGQVRPAKTLSGGETFVASLALALALAERLPELQSSTAAALDSLFLDEGFGTLDPETLETVISALEGLRSEERMVGIITHVPELSQRIESRIEVRKAQDGSTVLVNGVEASVEAVS
ncbi:MAG TPA: SbcC/MukB-like Walker B domain-containing protein, partial [Dehalococcoidia bacterium]